MESGDVVLTLENRVRFIRINRPKTKNAFSSNVYDIITETLTGDSTNEDVVATVLTGTGEYYSSGFDIKSAAQEQDGGTPKLKAMIRAFITYPKLLIALVNGPAIGIAVTTAALCDVVYASDRATFETPFVKLGLCAEACSSYTFPRIFGRSKASEVLILGKRLSAREAYQFGFISEVIPHEKFQEFRDNLRKIGELSANSVMVNKKLILDNYRDVLCECCDRELEQLQKCVLSDEFAEAILQFMSKKSKL